MTDGKGETSSPADMSAVRRLPVPISVVANCPMPMPWTQNILSLRADKTG